MGEGVRDGDGHERKRALAPRWLVRDVSGAAAVEYALLASLIAVTIVGAVNATGTNVATSFDNIERAERLTVSGH